MTQIQVGDRSIGNGRPCFIIAEAGSNHNGSFEQAKRLIDVAAEAGADAVKFQTFRASKLYPKSAGTSDYLQSSKPIYEIIAEMEMPYEWIPKLADYCHQKSVLFLSSVFDEESANRIDPHVSAFKIASYELTHIPLIRYVAMKGKPVIISTGTANLSEVQETVAEFKKTGNEGLILMQCTAAYPAPLDSLNLRAIRTMKDAFRVPCGLSDHSRDPLVGPLAAVALGANLIEKHFTLSNELPGPDHKFALEPPELRTMIEKVRQVEQALGSGEKVMQPIEEELHEFARRYIFAAKRIHKGETLTPDNVAVLRKGKLPKGLPPKFLDKVLGKPATRDLQVNEPLQEDDVA